MDFFHTSHLIPAVSGVFPLVHQNVMLPIWPSLSLRCAQCTLIIRITKKNYPLRFKMFRGYLRRGENINSLKQIREPLRHTISNLEKISTISDKNINLRMHFRWSAPIVPQDTRLFEWRGCILSWHWEVLLNDLFYRSPGAKNSASDEQNIQLELGRGQICVVI